MKKTKQYKYAIQSEDELILADLKNIFEEDFSPTTKNVLENLDYLDIRIKEHNWEDVKNELKNAVLKIDVRSVHGTRSTTNLEYHNIEEIDYKRYDNGLSVIAVGGSRLSRGITLEGLSVSYYLRTTRMYDSLMQMGRWFGYRPGYVDLCRLFSTSLIFSWFNHITFATEEMRNDFDELTMTHNLPRDFKLKVRNHHGQLTITSLNKLYFSEDIHISFSGENPQTYCLLKTRNAIENNFNALNKLVSNIGLPKDDNIIVLRDRTRYLLYPNSNIDAICNFIDSFQIEQPSINNATLTEYIKVQSKGNKIKEWSICIVSNTDEKVFIDHTGKASRLERKPNEDVATYQLQHNGKVITMGCSVRNQKNGRDSDYYFISKNQIDQTGDRYVDLMITGGSYKEIKEQRKTERKGLLLIYALDERCTPNINYGIPIVGYSIHFPRIDDETKVSYKVSLNRELDDEVMVDDDNPLNDVL